MSNVIQTDLVLHCTGQTYSTALARIEVRPGKVRPLLAEQNVVPDAPRVTWEFWRVTQSEYHYRKVGVIDLGDIS